MLNVAVKELTELAELLLVLQRRKNIRRNIYMESAGTKCVLVPDSRVATRNETPASLLCDTQKIEAQSE